MYLCLILRLLLRRATDNKLGVKLHADRNNDCRTVNKRNKLSLILYNTRHYACSHFILQTDEKNRINNRINLICIMIAILAVSKRAARCVRKKITTRNLNLECPQDELGIDSEYISLIF